MNKKHLVAATVIALAGLYLGCTNPQSAVDPRVQAGNATGTAPTTPAFSKANASGYWMLQGIEGTTTHDYGGRLALKQEADGSLIGQVTTTGTDRTISKASNANGTITFEADHATFQGTISEDGATMSLTQTGGGSTYKSLCTRLF